MNIYQLVNARKPINQDQLFVLTKLLGHHLRTEPRLLLKSKLINRFYSTFEGKEFGKQFELSEFGCEFKPILEKNRDKELKAIRDYILLQQD
jgi:hypothetical protein